MVTDLKLKSKQVKLKSKHIKLDFLKYIGPGILVTVGFIDPGNWASNISAGSGYGYSLLWVITLSTILLIILQHNAAHLGIATGYCISEAATIYINPWVSRIALGSAVFASISTVLAEILGSAIALNMIFKLPLKIGTILSVILISWMLFTNSYKKLEKLIIGFVSLTGLSFLFELTIVNIDWNQAVKGWVTPSFPAGSVIIVMSVLGAVVMPHNLFLHSEVIQSRQWNLADEAIKVKQLKYEFTDTIFSMIIGWAINSSMILVAASTFFAKKINVTDLKQAEQMLHPLLGSVAALVFALALLFSGISASVTVGMAGGTIFTGIFGKPYDIRDRHTKIGVLATLGIAAVIILFITNSFKALIYSQMALSIQLPVTIFLQIYLTSSKKVMGKYANIFPMKVLLYTIGTVVTALNIFLLVSLFK